MLAIMCVFNNVKAHPYRYPREFDYFRQILDIALNAGASVKDCESFEESFEGRWTPPDASLIHLLFNYLTHISFRKIYSSTKAATVDSVVIYFVKIGSSVKHLNYHGETPLLNVFRHFGHYSATFLQILLKYGVKHTAKDKKGQGALHLAVGKHWKGLKKDIAYILSDYNNSEADDSYESDDSYRSDDSYKFDDFYKSDNASESDADEDIGSLLIIRIQKTANFEHQQIQYVLNS